MRNKHYCISYNSVAFEDEYGNLQSFDPDNDYIYAKSDEEAIKRAKHMAQMGIDDETSGRHFNLELLSVCEFDDDLGDDVRTVWF